MSESGFIKNKRVYKKYDCPKCKASIHQSSFKRHVDNCDLIELHKDPLCEVENSDERVKKLTCKFCGKGGKNLERHLRETCDGFFPELKKSCPDCGRLGFFYSNQLFNQAHLTVCEKRCADGEESLAVSSGLGISSAIPSTTAECKMSKIIHKCKEEDKKMVDLICKLCGKKKKVNHKCLERKKNKELTKCLYCHYRGEKLTRHRCRKGKYVVLYGEKCRKIFKRNHEKMLSSARLEKRDFERSKRMKIRTLLRLGRRVRFFKVEKRVEKQIFKVEKDYSRREYQKELIEVVNSEFINLLEVKKYLREENPGLMRGFERVEFPDGKPFEKIKEVTVNEKLKEHLRFMSRNSQLSIDNHRRYEINISKAGMRLDSLVAHRHFCIKCSGNNNKFVKYKNIILKSCKNYESKIKENFDFCRYFMDNIDSYDGMSNLNYVIRIIKKLMRLHSPCKRCKEKKLKISLGIKKHRGAMMLKFVKSKYLFIKRFLCKKILRVINNIDYCEIEEKLKNEVEGLKIFKEGRKRGILKKKAKEGLLFKIINRALIFKIEKIKK